MTDPNKTQASFLKWLPSDPQATACEVARDALSSRLEQVPTLLELVAHHGSEDRDHVRRLRVATRRATTAVNLFHEFASRGTVAQITRDLKKIRKAAGRVRDLDVLIENVRTRDRESDNLPALEQRREKAEAKIAKSYQKHIASGRLNKNINELLSSLKSPSADKPILRFDEWSISSLSASGECFFNAWPDSNGSNEDQFLTLHNFRLQVKKLRYQVELLGAGLKKKKRKKFNRALKLLQTDLGEINDHDVAIQKTYRWMRNADVEERARLKRQFENEIVARTDSVMAFQVRWPSASRDKLQVKFNKMLGRESQPPSAG